MATKFIFRLQPVLEQRERLEDEKQRRVAELDRERLTVEEKLRACQQEIRDSRADLRARLEGGGRMVVIPEVRAQAGASLHLEAKARQTVLELAGAYRRLERARLELLQAATARRAVELLKERRLEEWKQELNRKDAAATDEAGTQGFIRQSMAIGGGER